MKFALRAFLRDLLSTIVFVGLFALTGSALITTVVAIGVGIAQIGIEKRQGRPVDTMQWLSLALVVVFSGASLATHDNRFIMLKPTLIHFAIGAVMLKRGWMDRYLPEIVHRTISKEVIIGSGYAWAGLQFAVGVANLAIALTGNLQVWSIFVGVVPLALQGIGMALQYFVFRVLIIRSRRGALAQA